MSGSPKTKVFSVVFGVVYFAAFYTIFAPFRYYPVLERFTLDALPLEDAGPAILWYAWVATAAVAALVAAAIVPRSLAERLPHSVVWIVPALLLVATLVYERTWFF
jgi:hypothetical protein